MLGFIQKHQIKQNTYKFMLIFSPTVFVQYRCHVSRMQTVQLLRQGTHNTFKQNLAKWRKRKTFIQAYACMKALYYKLCPHLQRSFPSCNSLLIVSFIYYSLLYSKLPVRILLYFRAMLIILFSFLNSKVQGKSLDYIAKFIAM